MAYTTINKSTDQFSTLLYSGNSSARSLTGVGFEPSWVWIKERTSTSDHMLFDQPRGVQKYISSNQDNVEQTSAGMLTAFDSDGFSLGSGNDTNDNGQTYVSWNWKGNGSGSSNTDGSITTTVSANTTAGFSIVKYTGGSGVSGIGHGLGVVPKLIICKNLSAASAWTVGSDVLNNWGGYLGLQSTAALNSETRMYKPSGYSSPTAALFYQNHSAFGSSGENMIAYCFAEKTGFSKFGKYTGNGQQSDNAFIFTGFKPSLLIIKRQDQSTNWVMFDAARDPYNVATKVLLPDNSAAETSGSQKIDFLSNGFKIRSSGNNTGDSSPYIYMAFAEAPLVGSNNIPCTAR